VSFSGGMGGKGECQNITKKFHAIVDGHLLQDGRPGLRHPLASAMLFVQSAVCATSACTALSAVLE